MKGIIHNCTVHSNSDHGFDFPIQRAGPFVFLPNPRLGHACEYCARLYAGSEVMCHGCGAPRKSMPYRDDWADVSAISGKVDPLIDCLYPDITICLTS